MNCDKLVRRGRHPWSPCQGAEDLDAYHIQDIPLIGTFKTEGTSVVFLCLTGHAEAVNVWAYLPLTPQDADELARRHFESLPEMQRHIRDLFKRRKAAFALARNGKVTEWSAKNVTADGVLVAALEFVQQWSSVGAHHQQAEQARLDVTVRELVPSN
jgi:hypothetical protein